MNNFARQLDPGRAIPGLAHRRGVLKVGELRLAEQARSIIEAARSEAEEIISAARSSIDAMRQQQQQETEHIRAEILRDAEAAIWRQAVKHQNALDAQFQNFVTALEEQALDVVRRAITILAGEIPPEQRMRACVQALLAEVGRPADCTLIVNEQDRAALEFLPPGLSWTVTTDVDVAPGTCRLKAQRGEWHSSFEGRLERLLAVFDLSCSIVDQDESEEATVPQDASAGKAIERDDNGSQ